MSHDTIYKAGIIAEKASDETKQLLRQGDTTINREFKELANPHVSHNSGESEWYTPPEYIAAARAVMGEIHCDPASSDKANEIVGAETYYTAQDDGLQQDWCGNVWLNPPYASALIEAFSKRLVWHWEREDKPVTAAVVLVNNATETAWFARIISIASAVVFPTARVKFLDAHGNPRGAPLQGQAVIYCGDNWRGFIDVFGPFGWGARL